MSDFNSDINRIENEVKKDIGSKDISRLLGDLGKIEDLLVKMQNKVTDYENEINRLKHKKKSVKHDWYSPAKMAYDKIYNHNIDKKIHHRRDAENALKDQMNGVRSVLAQVQCTFDEYTVNNNSPIPFINLMIKKLFKDVDFKHISSEQLANLRALMVQIMGLVEVMIASISKTKASSESNMANAGFLNAQESSYRVISGIKTADQIVADMKKDAKIEHIISITVTILIGAMAIATGQLELLAVLSVTTTLSETGTIAKLQNSIAKQLEKDGLGKDNAQMFASMITMVVIVVASMGVGAAAGAAQGAAAGGAGAAEGSASAEGLEMAVLSESAAETAAQESAQAATSETSATSNAVESNAQGNSASLSRAARFQNYLKQGFEKLAKGAQKAAEDGKASAQNSVKIALPIGIMNSNVVVDTVMNIIAKARHEKVKELEEEVKWLRALLVVLQAVIAMAAGAGSAKLLNAEGSTSSVGSRLKKLLGEEKALLAEKILNRATTASLTGAFVAEAGVNFDQARLSHQLAKETKKVGEAEAAMGLFDDLLLKMTKMAKEETESSGREMSHGIELVNATIKKMDEGGEQLAQLLAETTV